MGTYSDPGGSKKYLWDSALKGGGKVKREKPTPAYIAHNDDVHSHVNTNLSLSERLNAKLLWGVLAST